MHFLVVCALVAFIPGFPEASPSPLLVEHATRRTLHSWRRDRVRLPIFVIPRHSHFRMEPPAVEDDDLNRPEPAAPQENRTSTTTVVPPASSFMTTTETDTSTTEDRIETTSQMVSSSSTNTKETPEWTLLEDENTTTADEGATTMESTTLTTGTSMEPDEMTTEMPLTPTTTPEEEMQNRQPLPRLEDLFPEQAPNFTEARKAAIVVIGTSQVYHNLVTAEDSPAKKKDLEVVMAVPGDKTHEEDTPSTEASQEKIDSTIMEITVSTNTEMDGLLTTLEDVSTPGIERSSDLLPTTVEPEDSISPSNALYYTERNLTSAEETTAVGIDTTTQGLRKEFDLETTPEESTTLQFSEQASDVS